MFESVGIWWQWFRREPMRAILFAPAPGLSHLKEIDERISRAQAEIEETTRAVTTELRNWKTRS